MSKGFLEYATSEAPKPVQERYVSDEEKEYNDLRNSLLMGLESRENPLRLLLTATRMIDILTHERLSERVKQAAAGAYGAAYYDGGTMPEIRVEQLQKEIAGLTMAKQETERALAAKSRELRDLQSYSLIQ